MAVRLQFSIRSLLLLTLLVSLPLGYEAYCQAKHRREWKLSYAIRAMGGTIDVNISKKETSPTQMPVFVYRLGRSTASILRNHE